MLDLGETDTGGFGDAVTLGAAEGFGFGDASVDGGVGEEVVVLLRRFHLNAELFANAVSMLATVRTSPPLKLPSVLLAGNVAVGGCPTGMGS